MVMHSRFCLLIMLIGLCPGCGNSNAVDIERVLAADRSTVPGATSVAQVVDRMKRIDLKGCPTDFAQAYTAHIQAWALLAEVEQEAIAVQAEFNSAGAVVDAAFRGFVTGFSLGTMDILSSRIKEETAAKQRLQHNHQRAQAQIRDTFNHVILIAVSRGAKVSKE